MFELTGSGHHTLTTGTYSGGLKLQNNIQFGRRELFTRTSNHTCT